MFESLFSKDSSDPFFVNEKLSSIAGKLGDAIDPENKFHDAGQATLKGTDTVFGKNLEFICIGAGALVLLVVVYYTYLTMMAVFATIEGILEKMNVKVSRSGAKVGVQSVSTERYIDGCVSKFNQLWLRANGEVTGNWRPKGYYMKKVKDHHVKFLRKRFRRRSSDSEDSSSDSSS
ncbi:hypothetical protein V1511DRAFT_512967 [Dipodascopsis uninucleata]